VKKSTVSHDVVMACCERERVGVTKVLPCRGTATSLAASGVVARRCWGKYGFIVRKEEDGFSSQKRGGDLKEPLYYDIRRTVLEAAKRQHKTTDELE